MADPWRDAPPPTPVDGLLAVPVNVTSVLARLDLDVAAGTGTGEAVVEFRAGRVDGHAVLDLRQTLTAVELDGVPLGIGAFAHHDLGGGVGAELRVLDQLLVAGSTHSLLLRWTVSAPQSPAGGSYAPALTFSAGPRVRLSFGFTDLRAARYLEGWLPANLLYDTYPVELELRLTGTSVPHTVITNAVSTLLGIGHWRLQWPASTHAASTLLELRPTDTLVGASASASLPATGQTVTVQAWKLASDTTTNLSTQLTLIGNHLAANAAEIGRYPHGDRFTAFFVGGGMEYDGGTTTGTGPLRHETHHSWWGRGWRPASQADGWLDEGWTTWVDAGASTATAFDWTDPPVVLRPDAPWSRVTVGNAYGDGSAFFAGLAALLGVTELRSAMRAFWAAERSQPSTTVRLEEFLVRRTGNPQVVDAFHRFAYGLGDSGGDLWLRDDPGDTGGEPWSGRFWDSPDLWCRHADDGGTTHQAPERGQDNWLYARIRNRSASTTAQHFVVTFRVLPWAGTEFTFPTSWLPPMAAVAGFDLGPGQSRIVKARWPRKLVPPTGTHVCWLASVLSHPDPVATGAHTWEANGLAQKNLVVADVLPDTWWVLPFVTGRWLGRRAEGRRQLIRPPGLAQREAMLVHGSGRALEPGHVEVPTALGERWRATRLTLPPAAELLWPPTVPVAPRGLPWPAGPRAELALPTAGQVRLGLAVRTPSAEGEVPLDLVVRDGQGRITGGLAVLLRVRS